MGGQYEVKSTVNALRIVHLLMERDGAGVTEIADKIGLSKSAVYNQLHTLRNEGFVKKNGTRYEIGFRFLEYGVYSRTKSDVFQAGKPIVDELADITGETVNLVVLDNRKAVYLYQQARGDQESPVNEGQHLDLWESTSGIAMLSCFPEAEYTKVLGEVPSLLQEDIHEMVRQIKEQDMIYEGSKMSEGYQSIATPIRRSNGNPIGAIEVIGKEGRIRGGKLEVEIPGLLIDTAQSVRNELI